MTDRKLIAVPCKLSPGMFSSELLFAVTLANGRTYEGIAPRHFCWNDQGVPATKAEINKEVDGLVAGKIVNDLDDDLGAVEVPDGQVIAVHKDQIRPRPTEVKPPAPPPSIAEPTPNVSV